MYKKASRQVHLEWKPYSEWKQELDRVYIRCRNYAALLTHSQECGGQNFKNVVIVVREQDIPSECVDLLITPLGNLDINFRVLRALRKYNIYQLEDLLRFINITDLMRCAEYPGMGMKSVEQLYHTLKRGIFWKIRKLVSCSATFLCKIHKECRNCIQTFAMTMDMIDVLSLFLKRIDILIKTG